MADCNFESDLAEFSHMLYGIIYALELFDKSGRNISQRILEDSINTALLQKSNLHYNSAITKRKYFSGSDISLEDEKVTDIVSQTKQGVINLLIIGLCDLLDECLSKKFNTYRDKKLCDKINSLCIEEDDKWAYAGVHELRIIRNCIVHNRGMWSETGIEELKNYIDNECFVTENTTINLCFEDVFRFKRAVRTFINTAK